MGAEVNDVRSSSSVGSRVERKDLLGAEEREADRETNEGRGRSVARCCSKPRLLLRLSLLRFLGTSSMEAASLSSSESESWSPSGSSMRTTGAVKQDAIVLVEPR